LNVVEALLGRRDDVVVLGDGEFPAYPRRVFDALPGSLEIVTADVSDAAAVDAAFAAHRPDAVVHAAVITAGEQRELTAFDRVVDVNIKGTANVLAAAGTHGARKVVYVSSGSAYGEALIDADTVTEEDAAHPDTLYAITKHASERICARFSALRGLDVVCARLGSVFGPWERDTGVRDTLSLPFQIFRRAAAGEEVVLPRREARRDWVYSRDVASGIVRLLDARMLEHRLYNLSSGVRWHGFAERCCVELKAAWPQLTHRVAGETETPNVSFLGPRDRAIMSIARISDVGYRTAFHERNAHADYVAWLKRHRAYY
ncbi:MAG TPA: SDR family oxidoreductase, partial [Burkholderiales bacterium]|nr:SDR family oxidoreductase [Burkholderiales bacterium]